MAGHFSEFGLLPELVQGIEEIGWMLPTDIQAEAIPLILGGGDVLMAAETGSGKTGAFCLPVIQVAHETLRDAKQGKKSGGGQSEDGKKWAMSVNDREPSFAIDESGLLCQSREHTKWQGARTELGVTKGKWYYEATVTDEGLCRVGFSTAKATFDVGTDKESFGFGGTGKKSFGRQFDSYGEPFGFKDTLGCFIDLDDYTIMYSKNGNLLGRAFEIPKNLHGATFFPSVTLKNAELKFNFGNQPLRTEPIGKYAAICKAPKDVLRSSQIAAATPAKFSNICSPSCIIMEPSRELAIQTNENIKNFKKYIPDPRPSCTVLVGGGDAREMIRDLESGIDIVTGTPGKLIDFFSTGKLKLEQVRFFILDEADGLLAQNQLETINSIYNKCPKMSTDGKRLQMIVCSATLHNFDVKKLAERLMHFPTWIDLKGQDSVPDTVHHVVCRVDPTKDKTWNSLRQPVKTDGIHEKDKLNPRSLTPEMKSEAIKMLKAEYLLKAIVEHNMDQAIIFCRTKLDCDNMEQYLIANGGGQRNNKFSCVCLHSDRGHRERQSNLAAFKAGKAKFLICTDVAARGIDVKGIPFVVNVTLPDDKANYIHRIGRVGRAERMGLAISLAAVDKEKLLYSGFMRDEWMITEKMAGAMNAGKVPLLGNAKMYFSCGDEILNVNKPKKGLLVWYHKCESRGRGCNNSRLLEQGGCAIWYNEMQYLADIEEHLGETISTIGPDFKVPANEFDGKVIYGQKRTSRGGNFAYHTQEIASSVRELAALEKKAQISFLQLKSNWQKSAA